MSIKPPRTTLADEIKLRSMQQSDRDDARQEMAIAAWMGESTSNVLDKLYKRSRRRKVLHDRFLRSMADSKHQNSAAIRSLIRDTDAR